MPGSNQPLSLPASPLLVSRSPSQVRPPSAAGQFSASVSPSLRGRSASVSAASTTELLGSPRPPASPLLAAAAPSLHTALESLRQRKDEELVLQKHYMAATLGAELSRMRDGAAHERQQHLAAIHALERQRAQLQSRLQDSEAARQREQADNARRSEQQMQAMREELSKQQMYSAALVSQLQSLAQHQQTALQQQRERQQGQDGKEDAMLAELLKTVAALQQEVAGMRAAQSGGGGVSQPAENHWRRPIVFHRSTWYDHYDVKEWGQPR